MSSRVYEILRPWIFYRHRSWSHGKAMEEYFSKKQTWKFNGRLHNDNWTFSDKLIKKTGEIKVIFLPNISWISSKKHLIENEKFLKTLDISVKKSSETVKECYLVFSIRL